MCDIHDALLFLVSSLYAKKTLLLCLEGRLDTELADGRTPGISYQVADGAEPHRSMTDVGAKLFIVD